jgi:hypothetical protein
MDSNDAEDRRIKATDDILAARFAKPEVVVKRGPGRPRKEITKAAVASNIKNGSEVWVQAMCAAIISKQVLSANDVQKIVPIADAVVAAWKEKFRFIVHSDRKEEESE